MSRMTGVNSIENSTWKGAAARAVGTARATARFLGTNPPNTMDSEVAISTARNSASLLARFAGVRARRVRAGSTCPRRVPRDSRWPAW